MSDQQTESTKPDINLQLSDLVSTLQIFTLASSRGAFKPEEFTLIGGVYERLFTFLEAAGAVQKSSTENNQQGDLE